MFAFTVAPMAVRRWDTGGMVERAREQAGLEMKEFLDLMGISAPTWSRQQSGRGPDHISFDRMSRLPWKFWLFLIVAILREFTRFPAVEDIVAARLTEALRVDAASTELGASAGLVQRCRERRSCTIA